MNSKGNLKNKRIRFVTCAFYLVCGITVVLLYELPLGGPKQKNCRSSNLMNATRVLIWLMPLFRDLPHTVLKDRTPQSTGRFFPTMAEYKKQIGVLVVFIYSLPGTYLLIVFFFDVDPSFNACMSCISHPSPSNLWINGRGWRNKDGCQDRGKVIHNQIIQ